MSRDNTISKPLIRLPRRMENVLTVAAEREKGIEQNRRILEVIEQERRRLFQFIRKRVGDAGDAEDILQDVFYELIEAYRLMRPIEQVGAWLYRVARNRIVDRFRKLTLQGGSQATGWTADEGGLEDLLPSADAGPEAEFARSVLMEELDAAIEELPGEQRSVFVAHELEGRSFKEIAEETGININTLLSRKRYAILHLRQRLKQIYESFTST